MNAPAQHVNRDDLVLASQELAKKLHETAVERLRKMIRPAAPVHVNRASGLGHSTNFSGKNLMFVTRGSGSRCGFAPLSPDSSV